MTCGYYRTSSPVTARPIIIRWISDVWLGGQELDDLLADLVRFLEVEEVAC
jgi:hypothetical protein